ncbi:MAG: site-specific integrase, partial [Lentisphaerae bacterium]|nr:site-specific integrase [Lentisphaerota bacterium]
MNTHTTSQADNLPPSAPTTPDPWLARFIQYLRTERNASEHTIDGYYRDICQFVRLVLAPDGQQPDWSSVTSLHGRRFALELQKLDLARTSLQRKMSWTTGFVVCCPGQHGLAPFATDNEDFFCDMCRGYMDLGSSMFGCRICNFDACANCAYGLNQAAAA